MEHKLPYYMTYPMDLKEYGEEKQDRRDMEYMKSMYDVCQENSCRMWRMSATGWNMRQYDLR